MVQEQINALESRQLELQAKMASTDAHAAKCVKQGKKFSTQYPDEYAEYLEANEEYLEANEEALAELYAQRDAEADAAPKEPIEEPEPSEEPTESAESES